MLKKIINYKFQLILLVSIFIYLIITIPALFHSNHVMMNLEPYPDSLLYALSARNLTLDRGFKLVTNLGSVDFWVPPLYSLYLSIFYLVSSNPIMFYLANISLGILIIYTLYLIIKKSTNNTTSLLVGLTLYFSHVIIFWLPGLAISENLSLLLFSLIVYSFIENKSNKKILIFLISSLLMLLVRYSIFPIIIIGSLIIIFQLKRKILNYKKELIIFTTIMFTSLILFFQTEYFNTLSNIVISSLLNPEFFNINYFFPNLIQYFKFFIFNKGNLLWLNIGISSWPILIIFIAFIIESIKHKKYQLPIISILLITSLFPLQLYFYYVDVRYILYVVIIFSLSGAWLINLRNKKIVILFILLSSMINLFYQKDFAKEVIANNLFQKSTAWQYKAILHFNQFLLNDSLVITALPPFLIDAYQVNNYKALPMSHSQEFLQKGQYIWGDINYSNLIENYKDMLRSGKTIYISNSYITHQKDVILDYEKFKNEFNFELVSSGCLNTCNIYKLNL